MTHTMCTFNVNNLFVRYRFAPTYPGDISGRSAADDPGLGFLPLYNTEAFDLFNPLQRALAAMAATRVGVQYPDVICFQEVESLIALRRLNEVYLNGRYRHALLVDSRDFRQIDVGVLSNLAIRGVRSHIDDLDPNPDDPERWPWQFSRDCLEVDVDLGGRILTLLINHFKSKHIDWRRTGTPEAEAAARAEADAYRRRQAEAVVRILEARFRGTRYNTALFAVVGDLNDEPASNALVPLMQNANLHDALARIPNEQDRWTHWWRSENTVSQMDHVLLSPALHQATSGSIPHIERGAIGFSRILQDGGIGPRTTRFNKVDDDSSPVTVDFRFPRFTGVDPDNYGSDHCPIFWGVP
jgi:endonuclease/exonuclease/phosphatase family metal-dependent hydrolase